AMEASKRRISMFDYIIKQLSKGSSEGSDVSNDEENKAEENKAEENKSEENKAKENKAGVEVAEKQAEKCTNQFNSHQHLHHQPQKLKFKCVRSLAGKTVQEKLGMHCWWKENREGQPTVAEDSMTMSYLA
ncbi:hypothetical protein Tco_1341253, partial [Tanacetum coccineum]